jgi:hypothetical protein
VRTHRIRTDSPPFQISKAEGILDLATAVHGAYGAAVEAHRTLEGCRDGQAIAIEFLSTPDSAQISQAITGIDAAIATIDGQISRAQSVLAELLRPPAHARRAKSVIESTQTLLAEHSKTAIASGCSTVPLVELMDMEDQIHELIGESAKKGLYPESEDGKAEREAAWLERSRRIVAFLEAHA